MLAHLRPTVKGLILDLDGVLWNGATPIGKLSAIFDRIRSLNLKVSLATNNATLTVEEYLSKLHGFGVNLEAEQIVTSAAATAATLIKAFPEKGAVFVVGETGVIQSLSDAGFSVITDAENSCPVVAVVAGIDWELTYNKLRRATFHIRAGTPFFGTNPDATFPTPEGLVPGAGATLAALETAGGSHPVIIGKPSPLMFELSLERMRLRQSEVLIVGDRLETDIAGGQSLGSRTALVLSGVSTSAQAKDWKPAPDLLAADLAEVLGL